MLAFCKAARRVFFAMKKVRRVRGETPDKKVVKCPYKNKFVLRTAARRVRLGVLAFLQRPPAGCGLQGAARRVFFTTRKIRAGVGRRPLKINFPLVFRGFFCIISGRGN